MCFTHEFVDIYYLGNLMNVILKVIGKCKIYEGSQGSPGVGHLMKKILQWPEFDKF